MYFVHARYSQGCIVPGGYDKAYYAVPGQVRRRVVALRGRGGVVGLRPRKRVVVLVSVVRSVKFQTS